MTKKELIVFAIIAPIAVVLMFVFWPCPEPIFTTVSEEDFPRSPIGEREPVRRPPQEPESPPGPSLHEQMREAAAELVRKFGPARDAALKAAKDGKLKEVELYAGDLPSPGEMVDIEFMPMCGDFPALYRDADWIRVTIAGVDPVVLNKERKAEPDYELLACVLAALRAKREADAGEGMVVQLAVTPFMPFKVLEKVMQAAARAGASEIKLRHIPIPY